MKKHFVSILFLFGLVMAGAICAARLDAQDLSSPENTIRQFAAAIAKNDLDAALSVCAIDEVSQGFDFAASLKSMKAITMQTMAPSEYPMFAGINRFYQASLLASRIKFFMYSFFNKELVEGKVVIITNDEQIESYKKALDPRRLSGLELVKTAIPYAATLKKFQDNSRNRARLLGADDATERLVLYKLDDKYFVGGVELLRYGKVWKISQLSSALANMSSLGAVQETTVGEFDQAVGR